MQRHKSSNYSRMILQKIYKKVCKDLKVTFIAELHILRWILQNLPKSMLYRRSMFAKRLFRNLPNSMQRPKNYNHSRSIYFANNFPEFYQNMSKEFCLSLSSLCSKLTPVFGRPAERLLATPGPSSS